MEKKLQVFHIQIPYYAIHIKKNIIDNRFSILVVLFFEFKLTMNNYFKIYHIKTFCYFS